MPQPIIIADHDPQWRTRFDQLASTIAATLGPLHQRIEHVGSTSVDGLAAKPIIDFDVVIASFDLLPEVIAALAPLGYEHEGERGIPGRHSFRRADASVPHDGSGRSWPRHSLYVCATDSRELARHTWFRDYLRAHPEAVAEYARLKRELAARYPHDIDAYCEGKSEFVEDILGRRV